MLKSTLKYDSDNNFQEPYVTNRKRRFYDLKEKKDGKNKSLLRKNEYSLLQPLPQIWHFQAVVSLQGEYQG